MSGNSTPNEAEATLTIALKLEPPSMVPPSGVGAAGPWQMISWVALFSDSVPYLDALCDGFEQTNFLSRLSPEVLKDLITNLMQIIEQTPTPPAAFHLSATEIWAGPGLSNGIFPLSVYSHLDGPVAAIVDHVLTELAQIQDQYLNAPFDPVVFVDNLEQVNIASIPDEDMRCPLCWISFGTTYEEDDPNFEFMADPEDDPELTARQVAFRELPFCASRADNNPVRTPCGHLYGRSCLIESLENVDTLCPYCRQEMV
jgi:hypothetical protein